MTTSVPKVNEITLEYCLQQVEVVPLKRAFKPSDKEFPLNLVCPLPFVMTPSGPEFDTSKLSYLSHSGLHHSTNLVKVHHNEKITAVEFVLNLVDKKGNPEPPKELSHAIFYLQNSETGKWDMLISLGRQNGPSNLDVIVYYENGVKIVISVEKLFQTDKVQYLIQTCDDATRKEELEEMKLKIFEVANGLDAKLMAGWKHLPMNEEQINGWGKKSFMKLLLAVALRLADPVFYQWFELIAENLEVLGGTLSACEIGKGEELIYGCGKMGKELMEFLAEFGIAKFRKLFSIDQTYDEKFDGKWTDKDHVCLQNAMGVIVEIVFYKFFLAHRDYTTDIWAEKFGLKTRFPVVEVVEEAVVAEETQADTVSAGSKRLFSASQE